MIIIIQYLTSHKSNFASVAKTFCQNSCTILTLLQANWHVRMISEIGRTKEGCIYIDIDIAG